jgi:Ni/Co efflux regulator RcnB
MKSIIVSAAAAAILALAAPLPAQADPGNGKGHGGGQGHKGASHAEAPYGAAWAPPGLAKKPHGMPPGQAKKIYGKGERLPASYITRTNYVADPGRAGLATAPYGYRWVQVGDHYYLAQQQTGMISQVLSALVR